MTNAEAIRGAAHDSTTSGHLLESMAVTSLFGPGSVHAAVDRRCP